MLLIAFVAAGLAASTVAGWWFGQHLRFEPEPLREWLDARGVAAPLVFMLLMVIAVVVSPVTVVRRPRATRKNTAASTGRYDRRATAWASTSAGRAP